MTVTVNKILESLNAWAPLESAENWDNVGLLVGNAQEPVTRVLASLDVSPIVIEQAVQTGAELIVSHHPVIFSPLKRLTSDDVPYRLAHSGIAAIGLHTNLDKAKGGVNDILAKSLGLKDVSIADDGLCRFGMLQKSMEPAEFAVFAGKSLQVPEGGIQWINGEHSIRTVGVCSGAGGDYLSLLLRKADAFVTGELHYHEWPYKSETTVVAAGHFYTEVRAANALAEYLSAAFPSITVTVAQEQCPYQQL